uniref:Chitin deacetylase 2 n=1 Tax=Mamestra configurata TaxID=174822 RepID=F6K727_9NEOP|nr:chitin deacetylase 2 [Mamestra configurata]
MRSVVILSFLLLGLATVVVQGQVELSTPGPLFTPDPEDDSTPNPEGDSSTEITTEGIPDADTEELPLAEECDEELCKLPDCRCSSTDIPGGLLPRDTPQFVTITFDDGVNVRNTETYRDILYGRNNSNGCPAGATFYVSHEYTNYRFVNELYNQGYEIALHSISHRIPQDYWATASYDVIKQEIADQKGQISHFANIPFESIKGVRLPFLQMSGNISFQVMADHGLEYDSSWPTTAFRDPGLWPYTLDYASIQDCIVPPCPTASIPKPWIQPMVSWTDLGGFPCAMADGCFFTPAMDDEEGWYQFIVGNFERHYLGNRAPFGFYVHEWYLASNPAVQAAFIRFTDLISNLSDAFMVNASEVIDWVKNPIPVGEYREKPCREWSTASCAAQPDCGPLLGPNAMNYWMGACNVCPRVYPWTGNPLGQ